MKSISALDKLFPAPKDGNPGSDAVMYRIVCSNATPNVTDNAAVITLTAMKITGSKRETATLSASLHFIDERSSYVKNPLTVTIAKGVTTSKTIKLVGDDITKPYDIVTISPVVNGQDGTSVLAQYCPSKTASLFLGASPTPDESNIHNSYVSGDEWMRTKSSADASYGSWFRIVGENGQDGEYTDYTFNLSKDKTNEDAYTAPGNLKSTDWTDAPQVPDSTYPYLWMRMQRKNLPAGTLILYGREYTYVRLTGEDGKTVTAQYSLDGNTNWHSPFATGDIWMRTSEDGGKTWGAAVRIVGEKGDGGSWTDYRFNISSALTTSSSETAPSPLGRSNWEDAPMPTTTSYPYLWMQVQKYSDANTKDGNATYVRLTGEKGQPGQTGGVGPMMYYAGEWQSGVSYVRTAQVVPLVSHGDDQFFYFPAKEGTLLNNEPSSSNTDWKQQQKVPLLLAQLLMVDFGKIASAVFCGDYMMSQRGRHFDTSKNAYVYDDDYKSFDPTTYEQSDDRDWRPLVSIDFKEGLLRVINMIAIGGQFQDVDVEGKLRASLFYSNTKDLTNIKDYTIDPVNEPANCFLYNEPASGHYFVKLPKAADYEGLEISFFMKWKQAEIGIPRLHISCVETTDHLYCRCSATYDAGSTERRFIPTFDNLNIGYTDFAGTSVTVYWNQFIKFKSLGGCWYAIQGVFTGE
ncbi:MAG: hypothetical protein SPE56_10455 [Prevotella sp.]|nr:hypothetical protein [Prevotella sp.]